MDNSEFKNKLTNWLTFFLLLKISISAMVFALASHAYAGYELATWGMPLSQVEKLYPNGRTETMPGGGVFYRFVNSTFGLPTTLVTFSFPSGRGLNYVGVEFPEPGTKVDVSTGDYTRLKPANAVFVWDSVIKSLTASRSKPNILRGSSSLGGLVVWNAKVGDFIGMDATKSAMGRVRVLVRISDASDRSPLTDDESNLSGDFVKTLVSTWSDDGAFDTKWGMGTGDVRHVYPDLTFLSEDARKPIKTYSSKSFVEGKVTIHFDFFDGRLFSFSIFPDFDGEMNASNNEAYWQECDRWRNSIISILKEKYGKPFREPSTKKIELAEAENGDRRDLAWKWFRNSLGVDFIHRFRGMPILLYVDLDTYDEIRRLESEYDKAEEKERNSRF
jgi:hypothetical protein